MSLKKRGLGKGLDALLSTSHSVRQRNLEESQQATELDAEQTAPRGELRKLPIEWLCPGKYQPRRDMSSDALEELARSIVAQGIIQPIVVRQLSEQRFEIIAGERRWRAAQQAQLHEVPCLVKDVGDEHAIAIALIENIQREDLNAMEEAVALERLLNEFELTHQQVADAVGKSRTTVSNLLRLNGLEDEVKRLLEHGDIEMGHARSLLALEASAQIEAARTVVAKSMTVRDTEKLVKKLLNPKEDTKPVKVDSNLQHLEQRLSERLGTGVKIQQSSKKTGKVVINYASLEHLETILQQFTQEEAGY